MRHRRQQDSAGTQPANGMSAYRERPGRVAITDSLNSAFIEIFSRRNIAGPDEDPNVSAVTYASPPCYMHELDDPECSAEAVLLPFLRELRDGWKAGIPVLAGLRDAVTGGEISKSLHGICLEDISFCEFLHERASPSSLAGSHLALETARLLTQKNASDELRALSETRDRMVRRMSLEIPGVRDERLRGELAGMISAHQRRTHVIAVAEALLLLSHA